MTNPYNNLEKNLGNLYNFYIYLLLILLLLLFVVCYGTSSFFNNNKNNINNIVVNDRLLFANLSYAYYSKQINFYSPFTPGEKITHHFQLKKYFLFSDERSSYWH